MIFSSILRIYEPEGSLLVHKTFPFSHSGDSHQFQCSKSYKCQKGKRKKNYDNMGHLLASMTVTVTEPADTNALIWYWNIAVEVTAKFYKYKICFTCYDFLKKLSVDFWFEQKLRWVCWHVYAENYYKLCTIFV